MIQYIKYNSEIMDAPNLYNAYRLLAVLAHPDDETFGMGGTLALYASRGVEVHLVCATRGEVGSVDPSLLEGFRSIEERREWELCCAADELHLAGVHFLGYRDSGMPGSPDNHHPNALAAAPVEIVAARVADAIRKFKPQVVLTFDPLGGYKHPDHIAIHKATVRAFDLAGDPDFHSNYLPYRPQKLYFQVFPKKMARFLVRLMPLIGRDPRRFGRNKDIDLVDLMQDSDFPVHARIDIRPVLAKREAAMACHASQLPSGPPRGSLMRFLTGRLGAREMFMRAYPPVENGRRERDLFEGVSLPEGVTQNLPLGVKA
jgi:LmbE family N-acetylglucosaminyl deacetylase